MNLPTYAKPWSAWFIHFVRLLIVLASRHHSWGAREPRAATVAGCLPAQSPEARHSVVRPAVLDRIAVGVAGLESGLNRRPTGDSHCLAPPVLRLVLQPAVASEGWSPGGRRGRRTSGVREMAGRLVGRRSSTLALPRCMTNRLHRGARERRSVSQKRLDGIANA